MLRQRENPISLKAGALSVLVHLALLTGLLMSFNWKAAHPELAVTEVELWDALPKNPALALVPIALPLAQPEPEVKDAVKPVEEEKPKEEIRAEIALENKLKMEARKKLAAKEEEKLKQEQALLKKKKLAALQNEARSDTLKESAKSFASEKINSQKVALKKVQQEALTEEKNAGDQQALSNNASVNASVIDAFKNKIQEKIRGKVNKMLCGDGSPELKFDIGLLPTGELNGNPKLVKSSGNTACDEAVERAIIASEPLPLPSEASLFPQFRSLKLTFRPND